MGTARGRISIEYNNNGTRQLRQDMDGAQNSTNNASAVFEKAGKKMAIAGVAIAGGFALCVKASADFEKELSGIKAVTGASGDEIDQLRKKALQLGADTSFSAGEAAQAMSELAKAGVPVPDILNGAADATVNLAAAGEVALPKAAELAANAMATFALKAKDMPHIADLMAGAANASSISVEDFGESMKQAGAVAHLAGVSFEDTAAAVAILGNNGIKGSDAGTGLKTMLSVLIPKSKEAAGVMKDLGIITKDGSNTFFDAKGNVKSLAEVSQILQNATKNLTKEQKLQALSTIFGSDAIKSAAILADNGAAGFNKMADALSKVKAADVAKERMNNLAGSIEGMKGSLDTAMIQIGAAGQGPIKSLVDNLAKLINSFNSLSDGTRQNIIVTALGVAGFLLLGSAIIKTVKFMQEFAAAMRVIAGTRAVSTVLFNLRAGFFIASTAARALITNLIALGRAMLVTAANTIRAGAAAIATAAQWVVMKAAMIGARIATLAFAAAQKLAFVASPIGLVIIAIIALVAAFVLLWKNSETFRDIVIGVWNAVRTFTVAVVTAVVNFVRDHWMLLLAIIGGPIGLALALIIKYWNQILSFFTTIITTIINFVKNNWQLILLTLIGGPIGLAVGLVVKYWNQIKNAFSTAVGAILSFFKGQWNQLLGFFSGPFNAVIGFVKRWWSDFTSVIRNAVQSNINVFRSFISTIKGFFSGAGRWLWDAGRAIIQGLIDGIQAAVGGLQNLLSSVTSWIPDWKGPIQKDKKLLKPTGKAIMGGLTNSMKKEVPKLKGMLLDVTAQLAKSGSPKAASSGATSSRGGISSLTGVSSLPSLSSAVQNQAAAAASSAAASAGAGTSAGTGASDCGCGPVFNTNVYNPVAEGTSDSINRKISSVAQLGLLDCNNRSASA